MFDIKQNIMKQVEILFTFDPSPKDKWSTESLYDSFSERTFMKIIWFLFKKIF